MHCEVARPDSITSGGKYRTSCWTVITNAVTIEAIAPDIDVYYSYNQAVEVFEYDERGQRFTIFHLDAFQSCTLQNREGNMRERYVILEKSDIDDTELNRLYKTYRMPFNWRDSSSLAYETEKKVNELS